MKPNHRLLLALTTYLTLVCPAIAGAAWVEEAKLLASDGAAGDLLGWAVAVSGDTAIAGAHTVTVDGHPQQGAAYVFTREAGVWMEQAKLSASDGSAGDWLGYSVALSGDMALLGARNAGGAGAVYVFTRSGETWIEQAKLTASDGKLGDQFGWSVALSGDTALVGAVDAVVAGNASQGAVYAFIHSEGQWIEQDKLIASDGAEGDAFGISVALSGSTALIGAFGAVDNTGAAYVFTYDGETWDEQARLHATDGAPDDGFGESVALSGDTALVGAGGVDETRGAAYVFIRSGQTWSEQAQLTATVRAPDYFGRVVALSGNTALVGVFFADFVRGAAYVFSRVGESWIEQIRLTASDAVNVDQFGHAVGLSGDTALMGAPGVRDADGNFSMGAAYVFVLEPGTGPPTIAVDPESLSANPMEGQAEAHTLTIFNLGEETLEWEVSEGKGCSLPTWVDVDPSNGTVPDGNSQVMGVTFDSVGLDPGDYSADLCISSNDAEQPILTVPLALTAAGGNPELTFIPANLDFGEVDVGTTSPSQSVLLFNSGDAALTGITFDLPGGGFEADTSFCGTELPPGQGCGAILVTFAPAAPGPAEAVLAVTSDQGASTTLELSGTGVVSPQIDIDPESLGFTITEGGSDAADLAISNVGGGTLTWNIDTDEPVSSVIATWREVREGSNTPVASFTSGAGRVFPETGNLLTLGDVQMSQTTDTNIVPANSISCLFGPNHLLRRFYFAEHPGVGNPTAISSVDVAIQEGVASQTLTVNLYTVPSDTPVDTIPVGSLALIGSGTVTISPADDGTIVNVPVSGTVSDTAAFDLVVEATVANQFFIGATNTGETHPGFIMAPACGATAPTRIDSLGPDFEDTHIILVVNAGEPSACVIPSTIPWLSVTPDAGSTGAGESDAVSVTVDAGTLAPGDHEAVLCVNSDDPDTPLVEVPVALTVQPGPAPELVFDPSSLDFGDVEVGTTSEALIATLQNIGSGDATGLTFGPTGGGFEADTSACGDTLSAGASCPVSVTLTPIEPGPASATLGVTSDQDASAGLSLAGTGVSDGVITPVALVVDLESLLSDGNEVFEPGELIEVAPAWRNDGVLDESFTGTASSFNGSDGANYLLPLEDADYGNVEHGATASCLDIGVCYWMGVNDPAVRPATHWQATFDETLSEGTTYIWSLHIGDSFLDVPRANPFYPSIETLLHHGVTGGCTATEYCPAGTNTRGQMAVFLLKAAEGGEYAPPACKVGQELFADVPFDSPLCPWIEELAARQVTSGCGGGNYCPGSPVTRAQMAVFLLKTFEGGSYTPPECMGAFTDVDCPSTFADWIEELSARGITGGCSADPPAYCPAAKVTRAQMAVFVTKTFGLELYGP